MEFYIKNDKEFYMTLVTTLYLFDVNLNLVRVGTKY